MPDLDLDALEATARAATPGPWATRQQARRELKARLFSALYGTSAEARQWAQGVMHEFREETKRLFPEETAHWDDPSRESVSDRVFRIADSIRASETRVEERIARLREDGSER